jgi:hypothetical protein
MPKVSDLSESKYIGKEDLEHFPGGLIVTIAGWTKENIGVETKEEKYVLHFKEDIKPLILKPTIGEQIAYVTGSDDLDEWKGKPIVLWVDPNVSFQGKMVGGVRVKVPEQPQAAPAQAPQPQQPQQAAPAKQYDERNPPPVDAAGNPKKA